MIALLRCKTKHGLSKPIIKYKEIWFLKFIFTINCLLVRARLGDVKSVPIRLKCASGQLSGSNSAQLGTKQFDRSEGYFRINRSNNGHSGAIDQYIPQKSQLHSATL
jgi:hypothetical protein